MHMSLMNGTRGKQTIDVLTGVLTGLGHCEGACTCMCCLAMPATYSNTARHALSWLNDPSVLGLVYMAYLAYTMLNRM